MAAPILRMESRERYLAARVLDALLREDYGRISRRVTRCREGVAVELAGGRRVRLQAGGLFQDFTVAPGEPLSLSEVLATLREVADPADAAGVAAFADECHDALTALELYDHHRPRIRERLPARGALRYDILAAGLDHPVYPTARARIGLSEAELAAYAPEFAPRFELCWVTVPAERCVRAGGELPEWWPRGPEGRIPFPVHPLTMPQVTAIPGVEPAAPYLTVRPTLSMRTVAVDERTHLKLPLATSTLGLRNRRSIRPQTLADGARAERLLRAILEREPDARVLVADEQTYGHAGHEYLGWMLRRYPEGEPVTVAALPATVDNRPVLHELAARYRGGDVEGLLAEYLQVLLRWHVRLFVRYGVALEAHQQNLALVFDGDRPLRLLVKDNDGLLCSPDRLRAAGLEVPDFADERMVTDDPHALADVFVTITLHLAAAAVAFGVGAGHLVAPALAEALAEHGDHPMARLLRARTLDAARLVGKSMVTAATLVDKARTGARDVNKFYGTSGPNYLRRAH